MNNFPHSSWSTSAPSVTPWTHSSSPDNNNNNMDNEMHRNDLSNATDFAATPSLLLTQQQQHSQTCHLTTAAASNRNSSSELPSTSELNKMAACIIAPAKTHPPIDATATATAETPAAASVHVPPSGSSSGSDEHNNNDNESSSLNRPSPEKPIRNLTQAFEALCSAPRGGEETTNPAAPNNSKQLLVSPGEPATKQPGPMISPTGVADLQRQQRVEESTPSSPSPSLEKTIPLLNLHIDLQRDLSDHLVERVSLYSLLHDINKEAAALYAQDPLQLLHVDTATCSEDNNNCSNNNSKTESSSPLVTAVLGTSSANNNKDDNNDNNSSVQSAAGMIPAVAVIDEEQWLLSTIAQRTAEETASLTTAQCPATFLQAMGEKEYENPVNAVTGHARTQLWKPSRSWWEAKSSKNPWIEPSSHNKRWRYLWPLIHYHKFLAKCIKKLKRNGIEVKHSVSPVCVFLREEVCAVSDHLAAVSLFDSEEWMACLQHFNGWIVMTTDAEALYRKFIAQLPLRSLQEPSDINSPLLRSQIDESFLRTMVAQREQLRETASSGKKPPPAPPAIPPNKDGGASATRPPLADSSSVKTTTPASIPKQIHGVRRPRYYGWWNGTPPPAGYGDNSSVQSGISFESFPHPPPAHFHHAHHPHDYHHHGFMYPPHPPMHPHYEHYGVPPPPYGAEPSSHATAYNASYSTGMYDWSNTDPRLYGYGARGPLMEGYYPTPPSTGYYHPPPPVPPETPTGTPHVPAVSPAVDGTEQPTATESPYWQHIDEATLAMVATPSVPSTPSVLSTPRKKNEIVAGGDALNGATAPLVRQQYYHPPSFGYAPPSPATQFMMSPQASGFPYKYTSPKRLSTPMKLPPTTTTTTATPSETTEPKPKGRESPSTLETADETGSMPAVP